MHLIFVLLRAASGTSKVPCVTYIDRPVASAAYPTSSRLAGLSGQRLTGKGKDHHPLSNPA